jgi:hypothetical protein
MTQVLHPWLYQVNTRGGQKSEIRISDFACLAEAFTRRRVLRIYSGLIVNKFVAILPTI